MKLLTDFLPIVIFFIVYKLYGVYVAKASAIYAATASAIVISCIQLGWQWFKHRQVSIMQVISVVLILLLGGATLFFHNDLFIKWKPTALNFALAGIFLGSQWFSEKSILQRLLEPNIKVPNNVWVKLNTIWAIFFLVMGLLNIYVAYHFDQETWVNFKLFGMLGLIFVFVIAQAVYLAQYTQVEN